MDKNSKKNQMRNVCQCILKSRWFYIILPLFLCAVIYVGIVKVMPQMGLFCKDYTINENAQEEISLRNGTVVEQNFIMPFDAVNGVNVYFRKAQANRKGNIKMQLADSDGTVVYTWKFREDLLDEDGMQQFSIGKVVSVKKQERYCLRIFAEDNDKKAAKVCVSSTDTYKDGRFLVNGVSASKDLAFQVLGRYDGASSKYIFAVIYMVFSAMFIACFYAVTQKKTTIILQSVGRLDWLLVALVMFCAAIFFSQYADLEITVKHSEDLISIIKSGRFFKFYDIVLNKALDGGYGSATFLNAANYNIILYLALSIIIFPWVLLRKLFHLQYSYPDIVMYVQLCIALLDVWAAYVLDRVCREFGADKKHSRLVAYLFLSSSFTIFATAGFGQLDIIYLIVFLYSLLYFAKGQYYRFSLVISVAIMLKSFPVLFFIPMILLTNKKIWKILVNLALGVSSSLVFKVFFGSDYGYCMTKQKMNASYNFMERLVDCSLNTKLAYTSLFVVGYVVLCIWLYSKTLDTKEQLYSYMIVTGLLVYGGFAIFVLWHPQWLVILTLFIAMAIPACPQTKVALYCDLALQILYLAVTNVYFICNADNYMINHGILARLTGHTFDGAAMRQIAGQFDNMLELLLSAFAGVLVAFLYQMFRQVDRRRRMKGGYECERVLVWSRTAVMYAYIILLCVFFFYLG